MLNKITYLLVINSTTQLVIFYKVMTGDCHNDRLVVSDGRDIIARQHAVHADRDIVLPILSVCPSVHCRNCVQINGHIDTLFFGLTEASF